MTLVPILKSSALVCVFGLLALAAAGCSQDNPHRTRTEDESLSNVIQLTSGFDKAGEAYFSHDMRWIVFQAVPHGEQQYQMYVAKVRYQDSDIVGIERPIRVTPANSRNTCGNFSPDGISLIFASTAGKEDPNEPSSGYQREGSNYRWSFPKGMEIFRVDNWEGAVSMADPTKELNLAQHPLTDNDAYDAECAYSPDGKWICFTSNRNGGDLDIYVMHADGSHVVQITKTKGYDGGPFFSPDGKSLLYRADRKGNDLLQVFVGDLAFDSSGEITGLKTEHQITDDENVNWGPYWHPDNRHIIYATSRHGHANYELYLMRRDGSFNTRVTFSPGADILPVFSPDGKYLMWTSKRTADQTTQIFLAKFQFALGT
jgi:Tol biopolymer transport system component